MAKWVSHCNLFTEYVYAYTQFMPVFIKLLIAFYKDLRYET